jgi:hypothetical protein
MVNPLFNPEEGRIVNRANELQREFLIRFPKADEIERKNIDQAAYEKACFDLGYEPFLGELSRQIKHQLIRANGIGLIEDSICRAIMDHPEKAYQHKSRWLPNFPVLDSTCLLHQAVIFEALRQGSKRLKEWIKKEWRILLLPHIEPDLETIVGSVAFRIIEGEEHMASIEVSSMLDQTPDRLEVPLFKFIGQAIYKRVKEKLEREKQVQRKWLPEVEPEYLVQCLRDALETVPEKFKRFKEAVRTLPENRQLPLSIAICSMKGAIEINALNKGDHTLNRVTASGKGGVAKQRKKRINFGELGFELTQLSSQLRTRIGKRHSYQAMYEYLYDAANEGIMPKLSEFGINDLNWLARNVEPNDIKNEYVKRVRQSASWISRDGHAKEQRKRFGKIAKKLWYKEDFLLGVFDEIGIKWNKSIIWLSEILLKEREDHEKKMS